MPARSRSIAADTPSLSPKIAVPATRTLAPAATAIPWFSPSSSCGTDFFFFKDVHKLPVAAGDLGHSGLPRGLLDAPVNERFPEGRPPHSEADESRYHGRRRQPCAHLFVVLATAQDDAAHLVASALPRRSHHFLAVRSAIEPLDFPDVRLDLS